MLWADTSWEALRRHQLLYDDKSLCLLSELPEWAVCTLYFPPGMIDLLRTESKYNAWRQGIQGPVSPLHPSTQVTSCRIQKTFSWLILKVPPIITVYKSNAFLLFSLLTLLHSASSQSYFSRKPASVWGQKLCVGLVLYLYAVYQFIFIYLSTELYKLLLFHVDSKWLITMSTIK